MNMNFLETTSMLITLRQYDEEYKKMMDGIAPDGNYEGKTDLMGTKVAEFSEKLMEAIEREIDMVHKAVPLNDRSTIFDYSVRIFQNELSFGLTEKIRFEKILCDAITKSADNLIEFLNENK